MEIAQPSLLDDLIRSERPWKVARRTSRAAFFAAEQAGAITTREEIVGRALRYLWNVHQRSATAKSVSRWIIRHGVDWPGRDAWWILFETRRALSDLKRKGLVDTKDDKIGREFLYRWREAGTGERR